jgi:transcriptional regulator with XRE-family HTH domain
MAIFGHIIKLEREKRGWTQTDFGAKIGINSTAICRIENGSQKFSKSKLNTLSQVIGVDLQKLTDLFYADKFATEAYRNHCSDHVFEVAEDNVKYLRNTRAKAVEINFDDEERF